MQSEGILFLLIMIIIIPVIFIISNDTAFFIILSLILFFSSMKKILKPFLPDDRENDEETKELVEEVKDNINLDFNKLKLGTRTAKALIIILYFVYSTFFMSFLYYKVVAVFIIVYWIRYIAQNIKNNADEEINSENQTSFFGRALSLIVNIISLILILTTTYHKFFS